MSEVEKLYINAGVEKILPPVCSNNIKFCKGCTAYIENAIPYCKAADYPPFTAEKQLELVKWCCKKCRRFYIYNINDIDNFAENLAKEFNHYWQDLTEQERTEIAEILRG